MEKVDEFNYSKRLLSNSTSIVATLEVTRNKLNDLSNALIGGGYGAEGSSKFEFGENSAPVPVGLLTEIENDQLRALNLLEEVDKIISYLISETKRK